MALLSNSEEAVKKAFGRTSWRWDTEMKQMLGKCFPVLRNNLQHSWSEVIGLRSVDDDQDGVWQFPKTVLFRCIGKNKSFRFYHVSMDNFNN